DSERRMLGLRGASADTPGALKLARRKRVVSLQIAPLLQHYRLIVPGKLIMEPQFDEETKLVVVQLLGARKRPGRQPRLPWAKLPRRAASRSAAVGTRRGRPPKAAAAPPASRTRRGRPAAETSAPAKRRGRPPKAVGESLPAEPRRRGRPRKAESAP
ncbi:MAG: hypothetical protein RMI39_07770, partial [Thermoanaerobaculum sp.]|nr:hypothetical protein [Thermoanaerobaculum sp.]